MVTMGCHGNCGGTPDQGLDSKADDGGEEEEGRDQNVEQSQ